MSSQETPWRTSSVFKATARMSEEQKLLHLRAKADPSTITRAERNLIHHLPSPEEEDRLCRAKVGLDMSQLKEKAFADPDSLTEAEADIIVRGVKYDINIPGSRRNAFWYLDLPEDELHLAQDVRHLLNSDYDVQVYIRASRRFQDFDGIRRERLALEKQRRLHAARPLWVHELIDAKLSRWGFVIFRTAFNEGTDEKWQGFLTHYDLTTTEVLCRHWRRAANLSLNHRSVDISDSSLREASIDILRERFKSMRSHGIPEYIATDCFLVVDETALNQPVLLSKTRYTSKNSGPDPWQTALFIRAVDPDYNPESSLNSSELSGWNGEITIPLPKVFDWLYYCFFAKSEDWETRYKITKEGPAELMAS